MTAKPVIDDRVRKATFEQYLDMVRAFTHDVLIPAEERTMSGGAVPDDIMGQIAELGLFAITLPLEYGGLGWSMEQQVLLTMEFTMASLVYRSRFSTTIGLCSQILLEHGTDIQRTSYLSRMAEGRCVAAFALTEKGAGSDARALATTAHRSAAGWILNGQKRFITNGAWADLLLVFARTGQNGEISAFLVDRHADGVTVVPASQMNGHEAAPVAEIGLVDVEVPDESLVGGIVGKGIDQALRGINHARIHVAATSVGQAKRLLGEAAWHARNRHQFSVPLSEMGSVQGMLGRSEAEIRAGSAAVVDCAREFDTGVISWPSIAATKLFCSEMVGRVADRAVQILGGEGIVGNSPVPRMWRDVRWLRIGEGASEIHEANLGRYVVRRLEGENYRV